MFQVDIVLEIPLWFRLGKVLLQDPHDLIHLIVGNSLLIVRLQFEDKARAQANAPQEGVAGRKLRKPLKWGAAKGYSSVSRLDLRRFIRSRFARPPDSHGQVKV